MRQFGLFLAYCWYGAVMRSPKGEPIPYLIETPYGRRWRHQIDMGRDEQGRRVRATGTALTPHEALRRAAERYEQIVAQGGSQRPRRRRVRRTEPRAMTVRQYADHWLERLTGVRPHTRKLYRGYLDNHVLPVIGDMMIADVRRRDIEDLMVITLPGKTRADGSHMLGPSALANIYSPLRQMMTRAHEDEVIASNPCLSRYAPSKAGRREPDDIATVPRKMHIALWMMREARERRAEDPWTYLWLRLQFLGLRQGERGGLTWRHVKGLGGRGQVIIEVEQQLSHNDGNYLTRDLKTRGSRRRFPVDDDMRVALTDWRAEQRRLRRSDDWAPWSGEGYDDLVLTTRTGLPWTQRRDTDHWHKYRKSVISPTGRNRDQREHWRQHLNRHITGALLHLSGVPLAEAQRILGHDDQAMTRYYTAMSTRTLEGAAINLGDLITTDQGRVAELERQAPTIDWQ